MVCLIDIIKQTKVASQCLASWLVLMSSPENNVTETFVKLALCIFM